MGWLDRTHVAAVRFVGRNSRGTALFRLSVATGAVEQMVRLSGDGFGNTTQFALDLLNAPSVHAEKPQSPLDPRLVAGFALVTVAGAGWALVRWRQRVQP